MRLYEKIETIFVRDIDGTKKLIPGAYRNETIEFLRDVPWIWTEKVDGTNIRVHWDGHTVTFGGRTERASIPAPLVNKLNEYFGGEQAAQVFEQMFGDREVILFGEGYGDKIQAVGKNYIPGGVDFIVFDVLIGNYYQPRESVEGIAKAFGVKTVPVVGQGTLEQAVEYVKGEPLSVIAQQPIVMEGIVCRPAVELRDRCGNRLIVKIKRNDFVGA